MLVHFTVCCGTNSHSKTDFWEYSVFSSTLLYITHSLSISDYFIALFEALVFQLTFFKFCILTEVVM